MLTAVCSCALLLLVLLGPAAFLVLQDIWHDVNRDLP